MESQTQFLNDVVNLINTSLTLPYTLEIGHIQSSVDFSVEPTEGYTQSGNLNRKYEYSIPLSFMVKCEQAVDAVDLLYEIGNFLQFMAAYPTSTQYVWLKSEMVTVPIFVEFDDTGSYIYSIIIINLLQNI